MPTGSGNRWRTAGSPPCRSLGWSRHARRTRRTPVRSGSTTRSNLRPSRSPAVNVGGPRVANFGPVSVNLRPDPLQDLRGLLSAGDRLQICQPGEPGTNVLNQVVVCSSSSPDPSPAVRVEPAVLGRRAGAVAGAEVLVLDADVDEEADGGDGSRRRTGGVRAAGTAAAPATAQQPWRLTSPSFDDSRHAPFTRSAEVSHRPTRLAGHGRRFPVGTLQGNHRKRTVPRAPHDGTL